MSEPARTDTAWQAIIGAALARRGAALQIASLVVGLTAVGFALATGGLLQAVIAVAEIVLMAVGLGLGARTALDADLFRALSRHPDSGGFDAAMLALRLMPPGKAGRPMSARVAGLLRLLRWQGAGVALQLVLLALLVGAECLR